jgi:hypothetical protein
MIIDETVCQTSEEAFEIMNRAMPGEQAVRWSSDVKALETDEIMDAIGYLEDLRKAYFIGELDYGHRESLKSLMETLIIDLEKLL